MTSVICVPNLLTWPEASHTRSCPWPPVRQPAMGTRLRVPPPGEELRATGAPAAGHGPAAGAHADLVPVGRGAPDGLLPTSRAGTGRRVAAPAWAHDEDITATVPTEILIRPAVSVVVCAFTEDRWEDLCRVLGSLRAQTEPPGEIIVVIDHCPGLLRRARVAFPDVTVVPNHFQKGLAGGRNTGVAHAWGDVVAFIDDDAYADPEWLSRLADHYMDPSVAGVGGLVEPAWEHGRPGWFPPELDWVVGCSYLGMRPGLGPVRNFIGANMSFRREILAEIGGFSIELGRVDSNPFGCEETELCLRVSQRYPGAILLYDRPRRSATGYVNSGPAGAICVRAVMPRAGQRPRWRAWPGPNRRWRPSASMSGPPSPGGSAARCGGPSRAGRPGCSPPSPS